MKIRIITVIALLAMLLCMFAACSNKTVISAEDAQNIALEHVGLSPRQVDDIHTHVIDYEGYPRYSVHITVGDTDYEYLIDVVTGEILLSGETSDIN